MSRELNLCIGIGSVALSMALISYRGVWISSSIGLFVGSLIIARFICGTDTK